VRRIPGMKSVHRTEGRTRPKVQTRGDLIKPKAPPVARYRRCGNMEFILRSSGHCAVQWRANKTFHFSASL